MAHKVIWHEGMLLMPQHFQQQDRYFENNLNLLVCFSSHFHFGIQSFELEPHCLERGEINLKNCRCILPDGTLIDIPNNGGLPSPLKVKAEAEGQLIYLGVAKNQEGYSESSLEQGDRTARFYREEIEVIDNYAQVNGLPQSAKIMVGRLALQLHFEKDLAGQVAIPLLKLKKILPDLSLQLDATYIPPSVNAYASPFLKDSLFELENFIRYQADVTAERMQASKLSLADEAIELQFLSVLSRIEAFLMQANAVAHLHPNVLFNALFTFANELAIYRDKQKRLHFKAVYQHHHLHQTFAPLFQKIKDYLCLIVDDNIISLPTEKIGENFWKVNLPARSLLEKAHFLLAVSIEENDPATKASLYRYIKLAPMEEIKNLIYRALPGIDITATTHIPREIPFSRDAQYFSINQAHPLWKQLEKASALSIHLVGKFSNPKIELWAVK